MTGAPDVRARRTLIGHETLPIWNPVPAAILDAWIDALPLDESSRILDVGCGRAELLIRTLERHGGTGIGVDAMPQAVDLARAEAAGRLPEGALELRCEQFDPAAFPAEGFDLLLCIGSLHAVGPIQAALPVLARCVRPGGWVLLGEGYWRRDPDPGYLEFLEASPNDLRTHEEMQVLMGRFGLEVERTHETSEAEWSAYEDAYHANLTVYLDRNPSDPDAPTLREQIESWRHAYLRWGQTTLGFGLYLLRKPGNP